MTKKTILITGCSSGIGYCAAKILKERGYKVFASARKPEDVERLANEGFESLQLDVDSSVSIENAVSEVLSKTDGKLDFLFNNAGYGQAGAVEDISRDAFRRQFETNFFGAQELTNKLLPTMRKQGYGRIVYNSSILGFVAFKHRGAYMASKYAMEGVCDAMRLEFMGTKIYPILIEPGPIFSKFRDNAYANFMRTIDIDSSPNKEDYLATKKRLEREGPSTAFTLQPEDVVKRLIHALESSKPKARYYVCTPTYIFGFLKRILPTRWLDYLLAKSE
ncbi:MAG: SDR family NAD(P)-dependent oxidoreductase [Gammaproteobacteria bacterium]|nr:MAG: SDR family NAD(P)-dependent oxidoreductase [Gammaproteobacteria bacterium]